MNSWLWFVIAAVAGVAGVSLLMLDRGQRTSHSRERRRWAALRGWQFAEMDPVLPDRWRHGALGRGGSAPAIDLVTGSLFTAAGRRLVHVFDHVPPSGAPSVIVTVHRRTPQAVVLELWLPTVEFPADAALDLLGPVGDRYAFSSDVVKARPLITPELVALADDVGDDVPVMWIEDAWVAAAIGPNTPPARLERLLRLLGDVADLVDGVHGDEPDRTVSDLLAADRGAARRPADPDRDAELDAEIEADIAELEDVGEVELTVVETEDPDADNDGTGAHPRAGGRTVDPVERVVVVEPQVVQAPPRVTDSAADRADDPDIQDAEVAEVRPAEPATRPAAATDTAADAGPADADRADADADADADRPAADRAAGDTKADRLAEEPEPSAKAAAAENAAEGRAAGEARAAQGDGDPAKGRETREA